MARVHERDYLEVMELTATVRRDILREALFLCRAPFVTALSSSEEAALRSVPASSALPCLIAALTFFVAVFTPVLTPLLRSLFASLCLCLFIADLWSANSFYSPCVNLSEYNNIMERFVKVFNE